MTEKHNFALDKLIRTRIFASRYWKEECFALNAETLVDKAVQLQYIGCTYSGSRRPTKFVCLLHKMLQMNIPKEIAVEFLKTSDYKYLTALGLMYLRLTEKNQEVSQLLLQVYDLLEPFYNDNRKLRLRDSKGSFSIVYMDEFVDQLLNAEIVLDIVLPRIQRRQILEEQ